MLRRPAHFIAFGGGIGLAPFAPGSFGTLLAWPIFWFLYPRLGPVAYFAVLVALFAIGVWACDATGRALGIPDHGGMVWDETVAFLVILFFVVPYGGYWEIAAHEPTATRGRWGRCGRIAPRFTRASSSRRSSRSHRRWRRLTRRARWRRRRWRRR